MSHTTLLQYEAPWPVHCIDWCKPSAAHAHRPRSSFRLACTSLTEDFQNRLAVIGLQDERVLVEDDFVDHDYPDFVTLCEASHGYPATNLQWQPASAATYSWSTKSLNSEYLATTGEALKIWEYTSDSPIVLSSYVGRQPPPSSGHSITLKASLSGSKASNSTAAPPLTNFSWNEKNPTLIVTSSIDTTCTVWNIDTSSAITQLIAHDREVYDVAWLPDSTDIFVSVGADGSLRAFDLRSLEHSTILYETPVPKNQSSTTQVSSGRPPTSPLLRIAFNPSDSNYMATFHMDGCDVQILDMRSPGQPVMDLRGHQAPVNAIGWGSGEHPLIATAGDDCQVILWDLANYTTTKAASPRSAGARLNSPRPDVKRRVVSDPVMAYTSASQVTNLAWSPPMQGTTMNTGHTTAPGEWLAIASGRSIKALKV